LTVSNLITFNQYSIKMKKMKHIKSDAHFFGARDLCKLFFSTLKIGVVLGFASLAMPIYATQAFTLKELTTAALNNSPTMLIARAREDAADANVISAQAYTNPEVEFGAGPTTYRSISGETKSNWGLALSQPLEFSSLREARKTLAGTGVQSAKVGSELTKAALKNRVRAAFYEVIQRQSFLGVIESDKKLLEQIKDKVELRVSVGESPRYELIKAETELLAVERDYQTAKIRIEESKGMLRGLIGNSIPVQFEIRGSMPLNKQLESLSSLQAKIPNSPFIRQAQQLNKSAEAKLGLEQQLRNPGLTLKAGVNQDPDLTSFRIGVAIPLPLWSRREGQIAEATAGMMQAQSQLDNEDLTLQRELESGYQRYQIARQQLVAYESGLLARAESVLKVAESGYRYGERGILDYLDAQRTYRAVRKDSLAALYDLIVSVLEIERLLGIELIEEKL
jgi:cobalt-zinc-cadmium efflux system outer membrane protein